jgi:hypothetical protein
MQAFAVKRAAFFEIEVPVFQEQPGRGDGPLRQTPFGQRVGAPAGQNDGATVSVSYRQKCSRPS